MLVPRRARGIFMAALLGVLLVSPLGDTHAQDTLTIQNGNVRSQADGVLAILGLSVVPNETASTLSVDAGASDIKFQASQLGDGFT